MDEGIKENITDAVEEFSVDKDIYVAYDREKEKERIHRTDVLMAEEKGIKKGMEEGIKEGSKQKSVEIAKNLLKNNIDLIIISESTGLSEKEIKELQNEL